MIILIIIIIIIIIISTNALRFDRDWLAADAWTQLTHWAWEPCGDWKFDHWLCSLIIQLKSIELVIITCISIIIIIDHYCICWDPMLPHAYTAANAAVSFFASAKVSLPHLVRFASAADLLKRLVQDGLSVWRISFCRDWKYNRQILVNVSQCRSAEHCFGMFWGRFASCCCSHATAANTSALHGFRVTWPR